MKLTKLLISVVAMMMTFIFIYQSMVSGTLDFSSPTPDIYGYGWLTGLALLLIAGTIGVASINNEDRKILLATAKFYFATTIVTFLFAGNDSMTGIAYPQEIPIGASSLGAQEAFGLKNTSREVMIYVEIYGNDYVPHEAFFKLPVQSSVPTV